jgi:hypothetical protein
MCEWSLLVRIYDYLLINNKKLSISDELIESIGSKIHSEKGCAIMKSHTQHSTYHRAIKTASSMANILPIA